MAGAPDPLDFLDLEISTALSYLMRESGVRIRLGEALQAVESHVSQHIGDEIARGEATV